MTRNHRYRLAALVVGAAMIATAAVGPGAAAAPTLDKPVLKFGYVDQFGGTSDTPQVREALDAYFDNWNKRGGYKGHPVELLFDTAPTPAAAQAAVMRQVNEGVLAFVSAGYCPFTRVTLAPLKVLAFEGDPNCYDPTFMATLGAPAPALPMMKWAIDNGSKAFGVLYPDVTGLSAGFVDPLAQFLANNPDVETTLVKAPIPISQTAADLDGAIVNMRNAGVDALFDAALLDNEVLALQEARLNDFGPESGVKWISGGNIDPEVAANTPALEGTFVLSSTYSWQQTNIPEVKKMIKTIGKKVSVRDGLSANAYNLAAILERGMNKLKGEPTRDNIRKLFLGFHHFQVPLAPYKIDMGNYKNNPSGGQILEIKNGKLEPTDPFLVIPAKSFTAP